MARPTSLPTPPPPPPPASPAPTPSTPEIRVGEKLEDTLINHGSFKIYELTAPSDGLLVVQLSWNPEQGRLELWLEDTQFAHGPPAVGTLSVSAGRRYRVGVFDGRPWDYDGLFLPFVVAARMEQPRS